MNIIVTVDGPDDTAYRRPGRIATALADRGMDVQSVTVLDTTRGLTSTWRPIESRLK